MRSITFKAVCILAVLGFAPLKAAVLDLGHPTIAPYDATNIGDQDRSVIFDAIGSFTIDSAGIVFDPLEGGSSAIKVEIYERTGAGTVGTRGALLASGSTSITDVGKSFYDVAVDFYFEIGNRYELVFDSVIPDQWDFNINSMEFYRYDAPDGSYLVDDAVRVLDGAYGGGSANTVMPHLRMNVTSAVTPIPAAVWLFGSALAGLGWLRRAKVST